MRAIATPSAASNLRTALLALAVHVVVFGAYAGVARFFGGLPAAVCHWDCNWYGSIIEHGYSAHVDAGGYANWAFFPLFPLLGAAVSHLTGLSFVPALLVVNFVAFYALIVTAVSYARQRLGMTDGYFVIWLMVGFPYSFYGRVPYSEALFGLLIVLTLLNVLHGRHVRGGLCAALLCAARPTGILLVAAIGLCCLGRAAAEWRRSRRAAFDTVLHGTLFVVLGCAGLGLYMLYLYLHVGDALAFSHVEHAWHRDFANPAHRLAMGLARPDMVFPNFTSHTGNSGRYLALAAIAGFAVAGIALARRLFCEAIFLILTLLAATSTSLEAMPRIALCNPVSVLLIGSLFHRAPPTVRWGVVTLLLMAQTVLLLAWFHDWGFLT